MTVSEAAKAIGCGPRLVYRLCKERKLGHRRIGLDAERGRLDITPGHVAEYLSARELPVLPAGEKAPPVRRVRGVVVVDELGAIRRERQERAALRRAKSHRP